MLGASAVLFAISTGSIAQVSSAHQSSLPHASKKFTWNDRVSKNQFVWVSDAPVEKIRGTSEGVSGSITMDPSDITTLRGTVITEDRTMKTGNGTRDNHLLSPEWMDPAKYPQIKFVVQSVADPKTSGNVTTAMVTGDFTMHGVTKRLTVPFKLTYIAESPKTRERAPGDLLVLSANFNIALKDFKIEGTSGVVGSKVGETIQITAQLFGNSE
jgi:polyisoprenoid-binding protein YceI